MPYCRNCGAKLDDEAKFCRVCGTPVAPISSAYSKPATPAQPATRRGLPLAGIVLISVFVIVVVVLLIVFLPYNQVSFNQSNQASARDVDSLKLVLNADVADVHLILADLPGNQRAATNVTATGWRGLFGTDRPLALSFNENTNDSTLTYTVSISRAEGWFVFSNLQVVCDVYIDPSTGLDLTVNTNTGSIIIDADRETTYRNLSLQSSTGNIEAVIREGTTISGDIKLETTTGRVQFSWSNAHITAGTQITLKTTTGSVDTNVTQSTQLAGNVTLNAETTTGGVNFALVIENGVGARIIADTGLGGINVDQSGFSGNEAPLESSNYPGESNFDVALKTSLGGININADYQLGGTRT